MDGLPSMWRVELWHPLVVHFPIALLLVGTGFRLAGIGLGAQPRFQFLVPSGRLLLVLGTIAAWAAVYTGTLADAEVVRSLCDPTVVETHENLAYAVATVFTVGVAADTVLWLGQLNSGSARTGLVLLLIGCILIGSAGLAYVGHLGAKLVYQQAAAVHVPAEDCAGFE